MRRSTLIFALVTLAACTDGDIRGRSTPSSDGRTYLIIADDNGGKCGPMLVDGKRWRHAINEAGEVRPGQHIIACGAELLVQVDSGQTYRFDYWGP